MSGVKRVGEEKGKESQGESRRKARITSSKGKDTKPRVVSLFM